MRESTKIDLSLATFGNGLASLALSNAQLEASKEFKSELEGSRGKGGGLGYPRKAEDNVAELETLRSVKMFLTDKLK